MTDQNQRLIDHQMMHRALELARRGVFTTSPNPAVGCVITHENQVIAEGWHQRAGEPHAEINALRIAGERSRGATAYVTLEPCSHYGRTPPCSKALIEAGVARVVIAMTDPNPKVSGNGIAMLEQAGVNVDVGVLESAAQALNPGFIHRMTTQLPFVRLKLAASLDAKTALSNGNSQWITGAHARSDVQYWRARADAIVTGASTVLTDDPMLTVRAEQWPASRTMPAQLKQPVRVIIDSKNRIHDELRLFQHPSPVWLVRTQESDASRHAHCHQVIVKANTQGQVDLHDAMLELALRDINMVWTECGASLAAALWQQQLVSELFLYQSNQLLGAEARAMLDLPLLTELEQAPRLTVTDWRQIGTDRRLIAVPQS